VLALKGSTMNKIITKDIKKIKIKIRLSLIKNFFFIAKTIKPHLYFTAKLI